MKKTAILAFLALGLMVAGCVEENEEAGAEIENISIIYTATITPSAEKRVNIENDGSVFVKTCMSGQCVKGGNCLPRKDRPECVNESFRLSQAEMNEIKKLLIEENVSGFKERYGAVENSVYDLDGVAMLLNISGVENRVTVYPYTVDVVYENETVKIKAFYEPEKNQEFWDSPPTEGVIRIIQKIEEISYR